MFPATDLSYGQELLTAAKQLYSFAKSHQGIYSDSVPEAAGEILEDDEGFRAFTDTTVYYP